LTTGTQEQRDYYLKLACYQGKSTMTGEEIISAQEAHDLTKETIDNDIKCLIPIMNKIKEATKKMQYHCYIGAPIPDYVLQKLAILGYKTKLEKGDPRDPRETDNYLISW